MKKVKLFFTAMTVLMASVGAFAQDVTVTGKILDSSTGEPVPFASIQIKGTLTGGSADADGNYEILVHDDAVLVFSSIGYQEQEIEVAGKATINVNLHPDSEMLDETIVVAFGTTTKEAFTGSATVVKSEELAKRQTTDVLNALVGNVAGLQIRGGSGQPGASAGNVNIRGISSMYAATSPLVIVDGAPYTASLSNIPQSDIESVSVLKDASSAALYGARGASGVIIVTTKKGKSQNATINVDMKWGVNSRAVREYDVITDPGEYYEAYYAQLYNRYYYGQGMTAAAADAQANKQMLSDLQYNVFSYPDGENLIVNGKLNPKATLGRKVSYAGTDYWLQPDNWLDAAYKNSLRQEYSVSVNGATERSSYYMSVGYLNEDGIVDFSNYERITARLKADYQARRWLKLGANVGFTNSVQTLNQGLGTSGSAANMFAFTSMIAPIYPIYVRTVDANGNVSIATDANGNQAYDYGTQYGMTRPYLASGNPLGANRYNESVSKGNQLNGTFTAEINFTDFLKANITSTVIWGQTNASDFGNMFYGSSSATNGTIAKSAQKGFRTNNVQTLTYFDTFGQHHVTALVGHEYYDARTEYLYAHAYGMFSPDIPEISAAATKDDSDSYSTRYNVEGYFLSAQYDYDEKYFLSASYRRDASSYFAPSHRWGDFWSVGAAWILSKENFMSGASSWLDMLKLKFSIGQQGNDNIGSYAYTNLYSLTMRDDTHMSVAFAQQGNESITWETTTNLNAGVEFSFWQGRLSGNVDFYNKKTTDLLFWLSIPESTGTRGYYGNAGDIRNYGVELSLSAALVRTRMVDWTVSMNMSHNSTRILSLPSSKVDPATGGFSESEGNVSMWYREGGPLYNYYGQCYAGVDEFGQAMFYVDTVDENGNVVHKGGTTYDFNTATEYEHGSMLPDLFGGFNTMLRVKDFDFSVAFDYQIGGEVYDFRYASLIGSAENTQSAGRAIHKDWGKSWSPTNTESNMPRWQYGDMFGSAASDRFLTSASYLNFQSFTVGYTIPEKLLKGKCKIRVYASGENLWFWSARQGLDPRYAYQGTASSGVSSYSPARTISGGLQFTF